MMIATLLVAALAAAPLASAQSWGELPTVGKECSGAGAATWDDCMNGWKCASGGDVCVVKNDGFAECRPADRGASWKDAKKVDCGGTGDAAAEAAQEVTQEQTGGGGGNGGGGGGGECQGKPCALDRKCCFSSRMRIANCCADGNECVAKNKFYGACLNAEDKAARVANEGWLGKVADCGVNPVEDPSFDS